MPETLSQDFWNARGVSIVAPGVLLPSEIVEDLAVPHDAGPADPL